MKKLLLIAGVGALGYYAYRVWALNGLHVTSDPSSPTIGLKDAATSQASIAMIGAGALLVRAVL